MNRREAVKSLGLGVGFLVATPTVMSLLQSCQTEPEFAPVFLSSEDGKSLIKMVDLILPSDENIPGAKELGIYTFVDSYWKEMLPAEEQVMLRKGWISLNAVFTDTFNKPMHKGTPEEFDQLLSKYLKASKDQQSEYYQKMGQFREAVEKDENAQPDNEAAAFSLLTGIRGLTIWGWKSSEQIGENVLWYDPIPGRYDGCLDANEAGNGRAMSLSW